ncbi:hypothetical protein JAK23_18675 [Stenotrophomonas maltophilia]|uniref:hypothetical protein n=1 Tax=Stenotrophomonas maltophilia TaxID=40324 RepID=UPI0021C9D3D9|nr:hypothetical protein [Stenotrophomonas maltophilia]MCU1197692.1 hypothetical protein [Stenotrophomonas maltophilia]
MIPAPPTFITAPVVQMAGDPLDLFLRVNVTAFGVFVLCACVVMWIADDREVGR